MKRTIIDVLNELMYRFKDYQSIEFVLRDNDVENKRIIGFICCIEDFEGFKYLVRRFNELRDYFIEQILLDIIEIYLPLIVYRDDENIDELKQYMKSVEKDINDIIERIYYLLLIFTDVLRNSDRKLLKDVRSKIITKVYSTYYSSRRKSLYDSLNMNNIYCSLYERIEKLFDEY